MKQMLSETLGKCKEHKDVQGHFMLGIKPGGDMLNQLQLPYWRSSTQLED